MGGAARVVVPSALVAPTAVCVELDLRQNRSAALGTVGVVLTGLIEATRRPAGFPRWVRHQPKPRRVSVAGGKRRGKFPGNFAPETRSMLWPCTKGLMEPRAHNARTRARVRARLNWNGKERESAAARLIHDGTNFFSYHRGDRWFARGRSKQKRFDLNLVGLGLATVETIPILGEPYPGNLPNTKAFAVTPPTPEAMRGTFRPGTNGSRVTPSWPGLGPGFLRSPDGMRGRGRA